MTTYAVKLREDVYTKLRVLQTELLVKKGINANLMNLASDAIVIGLRSMDKQTELRNFDHPEE